MGRTRVAASGSVAKRKLDNGIMEGAENDNDTNTFGESAKRNRKTSVVANVPNNDDDHLVIGKVGLSALSSGVSPSPPPLTLDPSSTLDLPSSIILDEKGVLVVHQPQMSRAKNVEEEMDERLLAVVEEGTNSSNKGSRSVGQSKFLNLNPLGHHHSSQSNRLLVEDDDRHVLSVAQAEELLARHVSPLESKAADCEASSTNATALISTDDLDAGHPGYVTFNENGETVILVNTDSVLQTETHRTNDQYLLPERPVLKAGELESASGGDVMYISANDFDLQQLAAGLSGHNVSSTHSPSHNAGQSDGGGGTTSSSSGSQQLDSGKIFISSLSMLQPESSCTSAVSSSTSISSSSTPLLQPFSSGSVTTSITTTSAQSSSSSSSSASNRTASTKSKHVVCATCGKVFFNVTALREHAASVHKNDKRFKCMTCKFQTDEIDTWNDHYFHCTIVTKFKALDEEDEHRNQEGGGSDALHSQNNEDHLDDKTSLIKLETADSSRLRSQDLEHHSNEIPLDAAAVTASNERLIFTD